MRKLSRAGQHTFEYTILIVAVFLVVFFALQPNGFITNHIKQSVQLSTRAVECMPYSVCYSANALECLPQDNNGCCEQDEDPNSTDCTAVCGDLNCDLVAGENCSNCPQDCLPCPVVVVDGGWCPWSDCDVPCGGGTATRVCACPASGPGGAACMGAPIHTCNTFACTGNQWEYDTTTGPAPCMGPPAGMAGSDCNPSLSGGMGCVSGCVLGSSCYDEQFAGMGQCNANHYNCVSNPACNPFGNRWDLTNSSTNSANCLSSVTCPFASPLVSECTLSCSNGIPCNLVTAPVFGQCTKYTYNCTFTPACNPSNGYAWFTDYLPYNGGSCPYNSCATASYPTTCGICVAGTSCSTATPTGNPLWPCNWESHDCVPDPACVPPTGDAYQAGILAIIAPSTLCSSLSLITYPPCTLAQYPATPAVGCTTSNCVLGSQCFILLQSGADCNIYDFTCYNSPGC